VTIHQAVRALREHVDQTQQVFATELGMSISSLSNYERNRIPEPKQLLTFARRAEEAKRLDLAICFFRAASEALGIEQKWYSGAPIYFWKINPEDPNQWYEVQVFQALALCLGGGTYYADLAPTVISALALVVDRRKDLREANAVENAARFAQESVSRGYVPEVRGQPMWETVIRRRASPQTASQVAEEWAEFERRALAPLRKPRARPSGNPAQEPLDKESKQKKP
jgi:transcriptional regulator with XRE-family HTH domain